MKPGRVAIEGAKIEANASKHKAMREQAAQRECEAPADSGYCSEENLRQAAKKKVGL